MEPTTSADSSTVAAALPSSVVSDFSSLITWEDKRCSEDFLQRINRAGSNAAAPFTLAGRSLRNGYGVSSLTWLAKNVTPDSEGGPFDHAGTIGNLLTYLLTAEHPHVMDATNAASWGAFNVHTSSWQTDQIRAIGVDPSRLPRIVPSASPLGPLHPYFQARWGMTSSLQVHAAIGDHPASLYAIQPPPSQLIINMGTSSQASKVVPTSELNLNGKSSVPVAAAPAVASEASSTTHSSVECRPYIVPFSESVLLLSASLNGGNVLASFVRGLTRTASELSGVSVDESTVWHRLLAQGQQLIDESIQSGTPLQLPQCDARFFSERDAPSSRGSIDQLSFPLFSPSLVGGGAAHLFLALCRGLIVNLRRMIGGKSGSSSSLLHGVNSIRLMGAAFERNPILRHFVADVFGMDPTRVLIHSQVDSMQPQSDAAYGAALLALDR
jgi:sedoheptulokinase